jgi:hypothetical protein
MLNLQLNQSLYDVYIMTLYLSIVLLGICVYEPRNYAFFIPRIETDSTADVNDYMPF